MASIFRDKGGVFFAKWIDRNGERVTASTGETLLERAAKRAAELEAEARFWDDHAAGLWERLADAGFSPRYLWNVATFGRHMPFATFRKRLIEAGVRFRPASQWRDRAKARGRGGRRWSYKGRQLTIEELMAHAAEGVTKSALSFRIRSGWEVERALSHPLMSRAEAGLLGARKSNNRTR